MMSFSLRAFGSTTTAGVRRLFVVLAGLGPLVVAVNRAPAWLETWTPLAVFGAIGAAVALLALALAISVRASAVTVGRVALEAAMFACALFATEAILLAAAPESWPDDPLVQRMVAREQAAREQGIEYDARLRADVVRELQSRGIDAVPGIAQSTGSNPTVAAEIRARELLPLSNVSNAWVVECNEGTGFLQFRSDELGFNNPPGLVLGPVDVAVVGESMALGHCVRQSTSAVDLLRARFPRTANFGVAGARVLSQLGVFREYVKPLEPSVVVWFVNTNFAEPREELAQPVLMNYLNDPSFSQGLRQRQAEIDSFARELLVPLNLKGEGRLGAAMEAPPSFPLARVIRLRRIRDLVGFGSFARRPIPSPQLVHFARVLALMVNAARSWGGRVIVAVLPNYEISAGGGRTRGRYDAVLRELEEAGVSVVDGPALFAAQPDVRGLYTLRIENHPNEQGHALLAEAVIAAIEQEVGHEPNRSYAPH
jgi:hypothetical protein